MDLKDIQDDVINDIRQMPEKQFEDEIKTVKKQLKDVPVGDDLFANISNFEFYLCKFEGKLIGLWCLFKYKIKSEVAMMSNKYPSIVCVKDWKLNNGECQCEYKKGKKYKVCEVNSNGNSFVRIRTKTNTGGTWDGLFGIKSEYFDIDGYLKQLNSQST